MGHDPNVRNGQGCGPQQSRGGNGTTTSTHPPNRRSKPPEEWPGDYVVDLDEPADNDGPEDEAPDQGQQKTFTLGKLILRPGRVRQTASGKVIVPLDIHRG